MQTILGANGIIATELAKELHANYTKDIKLVSRNPRKVNETDKLFSADLLDAKQTEEAVKGSEIVYLAVGVPNVSIIAQERWPIIMQNVINACINHQVKLVFFDNTYMYGKTEGVITEETPFLTTGNKGKVRKAVTTMLLNAMYNNEILALICRAPEFYGPRNTKSLTNSFIFDNLKNAKKLSVLLKDNTLRTLIYTPDAGRAMALLGNTPDAYNQTWHLPCDSNRLTSKQFIKSIEKAYGKKIRYIVLRKWMIKFISYFNPNVKEIIEILYRYEIDNLFDSSKFMKRFPNFKVTTYKEGIYEIVKEIKLNNKLHH
jgi:nucleoside-diphosphate-sugar epimerase